MKSCSSQCEKNNSVTGLLWCSPNPEPGKNCRQDEAKNSLELWGSIQAIGPSVGISCSPDLLCFWLAAWCNQQVQRNVIIPGPDLSIYLDWIATMFNYCIKTLTPTLIRHDLLGVCTGRGWGIFAARDYFPSTACGQWAPGTRMWGFMNAASSLSYLGYPICASGLWPSHTDALILTKVSFIDWIDCERPFKFIKIKKVMTRLTY